MRMQPVTAKLSLLYGSQAHRFPSRVEGNLGFVIDIASRWSEISRDKTLAVLVGAPPPGRTIIGFG